jgi:hypothetical protein
MTCLNHRIKTRAIEVIGIERLRRYDSIVACAVASGEVFQPLGEAADADVEPHVAVLTPSLLDLSRFRLGVTVHVLRVEFCYQATDGLGHVRLCDSKRDGLI